MHLYETSEYKQSELLSQAAKTEDALYWKQKYQEAVKEKEQLQIRLKTAESSAAQLNALSNLVRKSLKQVENWKNAYDILSDQNELLRNMLIDMGLNADQLP